MPSKIKYKCQNPYCNIVEFVAMTDNPVCPKCKAKKVMLLGETSHPLGYMRTGNMGIGTGEVQRVDSELKDIAQRHGMSNMSNKGGKGIKAVTGEAKGDYGKINVAGVNVPVDHNPTCSRVGLTAKLKNIKPGESPTGQRANLI